MEAILNIYSIVAQYDSAELMEVKIKSLNQVGLYSTRQHPTYINLNQFTSDVVAKFIMLNLTEWLQFKQDTIFNTFADHKVLMYPV